MAIYEFYIPYLQRWVRLNDLEVAVWDAYSKRRIGWTKFYREARDILREKGIPRGYYRSVALLILHFWEIGMYNVIEFPEVEITVEEEEELAEEEEIELIEEVRVEFRWHGRVKYCRRSGHHVDIEVSVDGYIVCDATFYEDNSDDLRDELAENLWIKFMEFLDEQYVPVTGMPELETEEGFDHFYVAERREVQETTKPYGRVTDVVVRRANECGGEYRKINYLKSTAEKYFQEAVDTTVDWIVGRMR